MYASGKINGRDWKKVLLVDGTEDVVRGNLDFEFLSKLYAQLRDEYYKYTKPTNELQFYWMMENKKNGKIGDGWVTEVAYQALEKRVSILRDEKEKREKEEKQTAMR